MTLSDNWSAPVQSGCFGGCLASTADQKCTTKVSGLYLCRGKAWYTGAQCQTEPTVESSETPDYPLPQTITENEPCNYVTQADGTQTCQSKQSEEKEGQNCGEVNGERLCLDTQPTKNGIDISTEVATVDNPDGSKTTTKTDTATSTKCTAMNLCASTSTTVTTTTQTDANGDTTSTTGSCTGAQCPDDNTNPDGNGDGLGDCIEECGDGEGGGQDWYEPVEDTYASVLEDFTGRVSQAPAVAGVSDFLTFAPNGSCPTWSVEVWVFHVVIDQLCDNSIPWALVAAVIMGTAAFLSFRIAFL